MPALRRAVKTIKYEANNLFHCKHTTIVDDIVAVIENVRSIVISNVITRLYLQENTI